MNIDFISTNKDITDLFQPIPTKKAMPDWFKEVPSEVQYPMPAPTIKHCVPVTDMMSAGYLIKNTYEIDLKINQEPVTAPDGMMQYVSWRCDSPDKHVDAHFHEQCPVKLDGKVVDYFKIRNQWIVKTPPGYSCLFMQPFYFLETRYKLMPAIVDTDKYDAPVIFTGYLTSNYEEQVTIRPGDPLIQVIPFKRDEWQMNIKEQDKRSSFMHFFLTRSELLSKARLIYKNYMHTKKRFD